MASTNRDGDLFKCSSCLEDLDLQSKTLSCLHSYCKSCLEETFNKLADGENGHCLKCQESVVLGQLTLSRILAKTLLRRKLETNDWKCKICSVVARDWCHDCQKLICDNCNRVHEEICPGHKLRDLSGLDNNEVVKLMTLDLCSLHHKTKDWYCEECNVSLCDTCCKSHSSDSSGCSTLPLSVSGEAFQQIYQEGPILAKRMDNLESLVRSQIKRTKRYTDELEADCNSKCVRIWDNFEEMWKRTRERRDELIENVRRVAKEQVQEWQCLMEENERLLKQIEIWRINLQHLLSESTQDVDVACSLQTLASKLSSQLWNPPPEPCLIRINFSDWWPKLLRQLEHENMGSVSLASKSLYDEQDIFVLNESAMQESNLDLRSILVSEEDHHIFLLCGWNDGGCIMELSEGGEMLGRSFLSEGTEANTLLPLDFCSISSDILVVVVALGSESAGWMEKLIFWERRKNPSLIEIKYIIEIEKETTFHTSMCYTNEMILLCDHLNVVFLTKEGKKIRTIKTGGSENHLNCPQIRADPLTGDVWLLKDTNSSIPSELCSFDCKGQQIHSLIIQETISDFYLNGFGNFHYCNKEGIFSGKKDCPMLYKFDKNSEVEPKIFVLEKKLFVYLKQDEQDLIKIFKIFN